jgi:glycosyltransferase involved in cell wall biosynthesis
MPKVSIIIAAYNGEEYIKESINSILSQTENDLELLLVDDGSTDKTANIVKSIGDPRIKYYYQENSGSPAAPKKFAIKKAAGSFVGFCDQDDIYYPTKIEKQLDAFNQCKEKNEVGVIITSADLIDRAGKVTGHNLKPFEGYQDNKTARDSLLRNNFITACSALMPKRVLDDIGEIDMSLRGVEEYDLWLRITEKYGVLTIKEALCAWRQSDTSLSADKTKQYLEVEKIFTGLGNTESVRVGHGKNLTRIFLSYVLDKKYNEAKMYKKKSQEYPLSGKIRVILILFGISPALAHVVVKTLRNSGRLSL